jgi:hypothetical protein
MRNFNGYNLLYSLNINRNLLYCKPINRKLFQNAGQEREI